MGCYIVPAVAAIIHYFLRKKIPLMRNNTYHTWLNLLFVGGAIFGVVDHLWNGELFIIGAKPLLDLALGVTITAVILIAWKFMTIYDKVSKNNPNKVLN